MSKEVVPVGVLVSTAPAVAPELPPAASPDVVVLSGEPEDEDPVPELVEPKVAMELTCAVPVVTMTLPSLEAAPPVVPLPDTAFTLFLSENPVNFLCPFRPGVREADCVNPSHV